MYRNLIFKSNPHLLHLGYTPGARHRRQLECSPRLQTPSRRCHIVAKESRRLDATEELSEDAEQLVRATIFSDDTPLSMIAMFIGSEDDRHAVTQCISYAGD